MDGGIFIALGSNLGARDKNLERAIELLKSSDVEVRQQSKFYNTAPVGGPEEQPDFLNAVVSVKTEKTAFELLAICGEIENKLGRVRIEVNGPRVIDLDLLLFGDQVIKTDSLCLPHPRMHERLFVLEPLTEIAPEAWHPVLGKTAKELLKGIQ